jgi:hypothetical protein
MAKEIKYYGQLRPTGVDESGVRRLQAIAGLADQVQEIAYAYGAKKAEEIGTEKGLAAAKKLTEFNRDQAAKAKEDPEFVPTYKTPEAKEGFLSSFSIQDQAYNNAMEGAYLASMQIDVQNDIARIAADNPLDSDVFLALARESVKPRLQMLQDPAMNAEAGQFVDQVTSQYLRQIDQNRAQFDRESADETLKASIAANTSALINASKDKDAAGIVAATQALTRAYNARVDLQTMTDAGRTAAIRETSVIAATAGYQGEIRDLANEGRWIEANTLIDELASKELKGFEASEQDDLIDVLRSDLTERAALDDRIEAEQAALLADSRQEAVTNLFNGIMDGETTGEDLRAAAMNPGMGGISIPQYTQLKKLLSTPLDVPDDFAVMTAISDIITTDPAQAKVLITNNVGVNLSRATAKSLYTTASNNLISESVLNTSEARRFSNLLQNMIAPTSGFGLPGADEDARRWAQVKVVYDERVSAGERPALVAAELVGVTEEIEEAETAQLQIDALQNLLTVDPSKRNPRKTDDEIGVEIDRLDRIQKKSAAKERFDRDLRTVLEGKKLLSQLDQEGSD